MNRAIVAAATGLLLTFTAVATDNGRVARTEDSRFVAPERR